MASTTDESLRLVCKEIWGGNLRIDVPVELPGLRGQIYSDPADGGRGGDICFLTTCGSGLFSRIFVADVCGHGEAVATLSHLVQTIMRQYMHWPDPRSILRRLNQRLTRIGFHALTTAAVISYYPPRNFLSVSYAGHHPAWLRRGRTGRWSQLELSDSRKPARAQNLPLAVDPQAVFTRHNDKLRPGDCLVVFSDGVLEALDHEDNFFGTTRLRGVLDDCPPEPEQIRDRLLEALADHTGSQTFDHDDVTFLALQCVPGPKGSTLRHAIMNRILRPRGNSATTAPSS
jgi:sigma-B regulation protein RsbU (phosphoserine phosphatase)